MAQNSKNTESGNLCGADEMLPLVYDELRRLAAANLARENPCLTLDATALVHEAYLRLAGDHRFADRQHFFIVAAEAMRRILIDRARRKRRVKHGGNRQRVSIAAADEKLATTAEELLSLDEVLDRFAQVDPLKAKLVELRYFGGLTEEEAAATLGISRATASRYWIYARAWLIAALDEKEE